MVIYAVARAVNRRLPASLLIFSGLAILVTLTQKIQRKELFMVQQKNNEKRRRKAVIGVVSLVAAVAMLVGVGYAYFSDVISGGGTATAGTLDISGTVTMAQNGVDVGGTSVTNLNPGDVISFTNSNVVNNGTKSAWIREVVQFTAISNTNNTANGAAANSQIGNLADYLWVCTTTTSQATLISASNAVGGFAANKPADCVAADTTTAFGAKTTYTTADVINGSAEADGTWASATATMPVIYFDAAAPNAAQNGNATFTVKIQALQYRNNTTSPTPSQWADVDTAGSFAL
jgi:hypothetical protein